MLPGPWQGQSEKGDHPQQPVEGGVAQGQRSGAHRQLLMCPTASSGWRRMWQGAAEWKVPGRQGVLHGWVLRTFSLPPAEPTSQLGSEGLVFSMV